MLKTGTLGVANEVGALVSQHRGLRLVSDISAKIWGAGLESRDVRQGAAP